MNDQPQQPKKPVEILGTVVGTLVFTTVNLISPVGVGVQPAEAHPHHTSTTSTQSDYYIYGQPPSFGEVQLSTGLYMKKDQKFINNVWQGTDHFISADLDSEGRNDRGNPTKKIRLFNIKLSKEGQVRFVPISPFAHKYAATITDMRYNNRFSNGTIGESRSLNTTGVTLTPHGAAQLPYLDSQQLGVNQWPSISVIVQRIRN